MRSIRLFLIIIVLLPASTAFAQKNTDRGELWICPGAETAMFTYSGMAYGGSVAFGYSRGATVGLKASYLIDIDGLSTLELNILFRLYFIKSMRNAGPFIQLMGGPVFCIEEGDSLIIPADFGTISAGLCLGWRIPLGERWFIEPSVRGGHPYLVGAGLFAGLRL